MPDINGLHTDDEINQLVANGSLSPEVADQIRSKRDGMLASQAVNNFTAPPPQVQPTADQLSGAVSDFQGPARTVPFLAQEAAPINPVVAANEVPVEPVEAAPPVSFGASPPPAVGPATQPKGRSARSPEVLGVSEDQSGAPAAVQIGSGSVGRPANSTKNTTASETTFTQKGTTAEALAERDAATENLIKAEKKVSDRKVEGLNLLATQQEQRNQAAANQITKNDTQRQNEQKGLEDEQAKVVAAVKEYQDYKLDSGRWFANQSLAGKVFASLGLIAGGMGQALGGGQNPAIKIMTDAIERDMRQQEHELTQKRGAVELKNTVYRNMRDRFQDAQQAREATRVATLQQMDRTLETYKTRLASDQEKSNVEKAQAEIRSKEADAMTQLMATTATTVTRQSTAEGGKQETGVLDKQVNYENSIRNLQELKSEAATLRDQIGPVKGRVNDVLSKVGWDDEKITAFTQKFAEAAYRSAHSNFGALSNQEREIALKTYGGPSMKFETLNKMIDNHLDTTAKDYSNFRRIHSDAGYRLAPPSQDNEIRRRPLGQ